MIEPMYAENAMHSRPRPILKKSFSAVRSDSLSNSFDCLEQFKSRSTGNSRDNNLNNSSYDSKASAGNSTFFQGELERKFSNLSSEDFSSTQNDNLEYLKYNALSYQQNNVINEYEKEIYRQISDSSSPRYYEDVSRSNSCEDKVEVIENQTKLFLFF